MFSRLIFFSLFILLPFMTQASPNVKKFEGSIKLKKETIYDTSYVTIQVKGNQVRLDEYDCKKKLVSIYIINLETEKVLALSPKNKLFYELRPTKIMQASNSDTTIIKTDNHMQFDGQSCCQMRVKCISSDTEVAYWVTENNFDFFTTMNKILRKYKPNIDIFSYFPDINGVFPLLTVERTLLRKEKMKIQVTGINESLLSETLFRIPLGYQKIEQ